MLRQIRRAFKRFKKLKKPRDSRQSPESQVERLHAHTDSLLSKFQQGGEVDHIEEAVVLDRLALDLCPPGHPMRWDALNALQYDLWNRYNQLGDMVDIEEAILLSREALDLCPPGHLDRLWSLNNLAEDLCTRYYQLGRMTDLEEAIALDREALVLSPRGHPDRSLSLSNLAIRLSTRYNQLGAVADLEEAILLDREALDLRPWEHTDRSASLNNLAIDLYTRFHQLGAMADLEEAIVLDREALDLRPRGHPERSKSLGNLAEDLSTRYDQLGVMTDLEEAIALDREALILRPRGHPDHSTSLGNLAAHLFVWHKQAGEMTGLKEAIVLSQEALKLRPMGHPDRSDSLSNLAEYLSARHDQLGEITDLEEAIALNHEALDLRPQCHPERSVSLHNLAACLFTRFNLIGKMTNLNGAIILSREALRLRPRGHPGRSLTLKDLALYLRARYPWRTPLKENDDPFNLFIELTHVPQTAFSSDLAAAREWVNEAEHLHHSTTLLAYETSLRLLAQHLATLPLLPQHLSILKKLSSSLAVDAFSACLRSHDPMKGVELLEQGRGIFWNQITRLRSPLDDVVASGPVGKTLADDFTCLTSVIQNVMHSPSEGQHDLLCSLYLDMQKIVTTIRELPGQAHFLLPSLFSDLRRAARDGPVIIISASKYTCDALAVFIDQNPVHIPLKITKADVQELSSELESLTLRARKMDITRDLAVLLRELWDKVVSPVVDSLKVTVPAQSRIWWCPTAEFTLLPLHAAGPYRRGQQNLGDLYISSYTPTLTALIRARHHTCSSSETKVKNFVAVGQRKAAGGDELASVGIELDVIGQRLKALAAFTRIEGSDACISQVLEKLTKNEWVHLACHGLPDRKQPFESAFALYDGQFTVRHIMRCELDNPEFAFLSACHTTVGDEESPDEVIHLSSAMHFAGFRSVIGTMWGVDDGHTSKIASMFYAHMMDESGHLDHTRAASALNETMKKVDIPFDQRILYVHIGV